MDAKKYYRLAVAAKETGAHRTTLRSAILRGELPCVYTGCGLPLVTLRDVQRFAKAEDTRRPGRKPKPAEPTRRGRPKAGE